MLLITEVDTQCNNNQMYNQVAFIHPPTHTTGGCSLNYALVESHGGQLIIAENPINVHPTKS